MQMANEPPPKRPARILSKSTLDQWIKDHPDAADSLRAWHTTLSKLKFNSFPELNQKISNASLVNSEYLIFPINGNNYRIVVTVFFSNGGPQLYLKYFFTHKEYNTWSDNSRKSKKK